MTNNYCTLFDSNYLAFGINLIESLKEHDENGIIYVITLDKIAHDELLRLSFNNVVLIDGSKLPNLKNYNLKYVIKGDEKIPEISAASIIAKVARDRLITKMSKKFIKYAWDKNAGYGTKLHLIAIKKFGITKYHRKTFSPIHNILSPN